MQKHFTKLELFFLTNIFSSQNVLAILGAEKISTVNNKNMKKKKIGIKK